MAIELAEMYVSVIPEAKGVSASLARQFKPAQSIAATAGRDSGSRFASAFRSTTSSIGRSLGTVLKYGAGAAAVGIGAAGAVGLKTAAQLETAEIGFTTMLGSAGKARKFLGELGTFAAKTPFDLPGLQESASSLVSIGIDSKKVIPIMTTLGNVTSGMGTGAEGIKRATTAIQQMNAAGKINAEDLNQLRDAGIPVYDLLTAATGKTTAQISEMRDKGQLGRKELEALMTALETGKGLERFNGLMDKQSQSLTGLVSTFKDTFSVGLAKAIKPLIPMIKDGLAGATALLADVILPKVQSGLKATVDFFGRLGKAVKVFKAGGINSDIAKTLGLTGRTSQIFQEVLGGFRAFVSAWKSEATSISEVSSSGGFAGVMEQIAVKTRAVKNAIGSLDFSSVKGFLASLSVVGGDTGGALASIGDSFVKLAPAFQDFAASVPALAGGGLQLLASALGFVADHVDTIIKYMPLIVAGFVAFKVAQRAAAAAAIASIPIQLAANVARLSAARAELTLTRAQKANTVSTLTNTTATSANTTTQRAGLLTRLRAAAATTGHKIALVAHTVATKAAAVGQRILNAAMRANPIGLIITAIAALVAGLVWFFTKTELGQKIVRKAWAAIKVGVGAVVAWFKDTALPFMEKVWAVIGAGAKWLYEEKIRPAWAGIKLAVKLVAGWFKNVLAPGIKAVFEGIGGVFKWLWNKVVKPVFGFIKAYIKAWWIVVKAIFKGAVWFVENVLGPVFRWLWNKVVKPVFGWIGDKIGDFWRGAKVIFRAVKDFIRDTLGPAFDWLWKKVIKPVFRGIGDVISGVWKNGIKPIFKSLAKFITETIPDAFRTGVRGIKGFWEDLKSIAKKPIKFMIDTVYNKGIRGVFNTVMDFVGSDIRLPKLNIKGFRKGGYTGNVGKNEVAGVTHGREYVVNAEATKQIQSKHPGLLEGMNSKGAAAIANTIQGGGGGTRGFSPIWGPFQNAIRAAGRLSVGTGAGPAWNIPSAASMWDKLAGLRVRAGGSAPHATTGLGALGSILAWATGSGNITFNTQGLAPSLSPVMKSATAAHEIGHVLGLPHTMGASIMQPTIGKYMTPTSMDKKRLESLYGPGSRAPGGGGFDLLGWIADKITAPIKSLVSGLVDKIPGGGRFVDLAAAVAKFVVKSVKDWAIDKVSSFGGEDPRDKGTSTGTNKFGAFPGTLHDSGGVVPTGKSLLDNQSRKPEALLNSGQWSTAHRAMDAVERQAVAQPLPDIYVQNPFTGEWMLAKVDERVKAGQTAWNRDQLARRNGGGR